MKIAGYVHPGIFAEGPFWNYAWVDIIARLLQTLRGDSPCECILIVGSRFADQARQIAPGLLEGLRVVEIDEVLVARRSSELGATPGSFNRLAYDPETADHPALQYLADEIRRLSGPFEPDVLISFAVQTDFLARVWPRTFRLHTEAGPYSRNPFPFSLFLDHLGMYGRSVVSREGARLTGYGADGQAGESPAPDDNANASLSRVIRRHFAAALAATDPFRPLDLRARFEKIFLLPLQVSNWYGFDEQSEYRTQFEYLLDTLAAVPRHIGAVVTEHVVWGAVLKDGGPDHNLSYLRKTFPNLVFDERFRHYLSSSQFLVPRVDGVWSVSSNVGYQALLFDTQLGSPPRSHLAAVAHATELNAFFDAIESGRHRTREAFTNWQFERYLIPQSLLANGAWLRDYLCRRIDAAKSAKDPLDAFVPIADRAALETAWIRDAPRPHAEPYGNRTGPASKRSLARLWRKATRALPASKPFRCDKTPPGQLAPRFR